MSKSFRVIGDIDAEALNRALLMCCPDKIVTFSNATRNDNSIPPAESSILIIEDREEATSELTPTHDQTTSSLSDLQKQQHDLFDEFVLLRQRYDEIKYQLSNTLWGHCFPVHPDLQNIPRMEPSESLKESSSLVGPYVVEDILGEGMFATVKSCRLVDTDEKYALKIINKEKLGTFNSIKRVANEIGILREMKDCKYIIKFKEAMHTQNFVYIVTEIGGSDMFDFFDQYPDGVKESWGKIIALEILKAVSSCHSRSFCHRDLKPENILLRFDPISGNCLDLRLCDFGLGVKIDVNTPLFEFCGSPGFFAPEMITKGAYYGDRADVWSLGCIILELILGHEVFCDVWMSAYDFDILQDKLKFAHAISTSLQKLRGESANSFQTSSSKSNGSANSGSTSMESLPSPRSAPLLSGVLGASGLSEELVDFIFQCLTLQSSKRSSVKSLLRHPWVTDDLLHSRRSFSPPKNRTISFDSSDSCAMSPISTSIHLASDFIQLSCKERKMIEDFNSHHVGVSELHLPPLEPPTPSVSKARKMFSG